MLGRWKANRSTGWMKNNTPSQAKTIPAGWKRTAPSSIYCLPSKRRQTVICAWGKRLQRSMLLDLAADLCTVRRKGHGNLDCHCCRRFSWPRILFDTLIDTENLIDCGTITERIWIIRWWLFVSTEWKKSRRDGNAAMTLAIIFGFIIFFQFSYSMRVYSTCTI